MKWQAIQHPTAHLHRPSAQCSALTKMTVSAFVLASSTRPGMHAHGSRAATSTRLAPADKASKDVPLGGLPLQLLCRRGTPSILQSSHIGGIEEEGACCCLGGIERRLVRWNAAFHPRRVKPAAGALPAAQVWQGREQAGHLPGPPHG